MSVRDGSGAREPQLWPFRQAGSIVRRDVPLSGDRAVGAGGTEECVHLNPSVPTEDLGGTPLWPPLPPGPSLTGHAAFCKDEKEKARPPHAACRTLQQKGFCTCKESGVMRKTSRCRVLRLEGKCRALWGPIGGACTRPLCSPQNPTMAQKGILFSEKDAAGVPAQAGWCPCGLGSEPFSCPRSWLAPGWWMWGSRELTARPGTGEGDRPMRHCPPKSQMRKQAGRQCPAPRAGSRGHPWVEGVPGGGPTLSWERDHIRRGA